jgi:hypothetical protein
MFDLIGAPTGVAVGADPLQVVDDLDEVGPACLKALERIARHLGALGAGGVAFLGGTVAVPAVAAGERHSARAAPIAGEAFLRPAERCGRRGKVAVLGTTVDQTGSTVEAAVRIESC